MTVKWREIFTTEYDKEMDKISQLFTPFQKLSSIGNSLDLLFQFEGDFILVGGIARRFYSSPRNTGDIDILFRGEGELQEFLLKNKGKYKPLRKHAIMVSGVEVDLLTPEFLNINPPLVDYIFNNYEIYENIKISPREGIILLKLMRMSPTDDNDIRALIESGGKNLKVQDILNLSGEGQREVINSLLNQSKMFLEE